MCGCLIVGIFVVCRMLRYNIALGIRICAFKILIYFGCKSKVFFFIISCSLSKNNVFDIFYVF